jgi:hypothetical protein
MEVGSHRDVIIQSLTAVLLSLVPLSVQAQYTGGAGSGATMATTGSAPVALPVELIGFSASLRNSAVHLTWMTATETNNYGFEIQRREHDEWRVIGFVAGHGTKSTPTTYKYVDTLLPALAVFDGLSYRLRQINRDGSSECSSVVRIAVTAVLKDLIIEEVYPVPASSVVCAVFTLVRHSTLSISVCSADGRLVRTLADASSYDAGVHHIIIGREKLPYGAYWLTIDSPIGHQSRVIHFTP